MATPPTRVSYNTPSTGNYSTTATSRTTTAFAVNAGDLIVVLASIESAGTNANVTPTASGGSVTWTLRASQTAGGVNQSGAWCWTGVVGATAASITVSLNRPNTTTTYWWGFSATVYRNHGGVGVAFSGNNGTASGAPSVAATCAANSAVVCQVNDWNAADGTTRTWRTVNGAPETETVYFRDAAHHGVYGAYRADTGAAGSITQGLTAPSTMRWVLVGVEILGTASSATTGTVSASVPVATSSISGAAAVPTATGTISANVPRASSSLAGTVTSPAATGTLAASTPALTSTATGVATAPAYSGALSASLPTVTGSLSGAASAPSSSGTVAASTPPPTSSIAGTVTSPTYSGTLAGSTPRTTGGMSGTVSAPTYSGTLTAPILPTRSSIAGTVTTPAGAATLLASVPRVTGSMGGTVSTPVYVAVLTGSLPRTTAATSGTVASPPTVGTLLATTPALVGSLAGVYTAPASTEQYDLTATPAPTMTVAAAPAALTVTSASRDLTVTAAPPALTVRSAP